MLKQFSGRQKILGAIILLFMWNLLGKQTFADVPPGTIAFLSDRAPDHKHPRLSDITVYLIDADGFNEGFWKRSNFRHGPIAWSPDGKSIAYHLQDPQQERLIAHIWLEIPVIRDHDMFLENPPENVTRQFGGREYRSPKWSPDGKWLALTSTDGSPDDKADVCIMDIEGNQLKNLTQAPGIDEVGSWSPDGSKIVFFSNRDGNGEIYVMDSNGKNQVNLTNHRALDAAPTWSPDGTRIAFHSRRKGGQDDIYVMNPDGADVVNLTRHPWEDRAPAWSPDGRWIAFHSSRIRRHPDIYVMAANGDNLRQLTRHPASDTDPTWVIPDRSLSVEVSGNQTTLWGCIKLERQ